MNNKAENINDFIEKVFHPIEREDLLKVDLTFLKSIPLGENECLYLYDLTQNKILYKKGFTQCLGYEENSISFNFLFENMHPDDVEIVQKITKNAISFSIEHPDNSIQNQLFITYRHKTKSGDYIKILNQISIFEVDKKGVLKSLLIRLLDISFLDKTDYVNWDFKANGIDIETFKNNIYTNRLTYFTPRELELIHEINKGHTNKQIAIDLEISEHTVGTHRKNILRKSNCHNFIELEIFCKGNGIL